MKFNCGPTWEEKWDKEKTLLRDWHLFFAIIPRRVGERDCRWLEWIERKGETYQDYALPPAPPFKVTKWRWEYRAKGGQG